MSDYFPAPDELRDAYINDYDLGFPLDEESMDQSSQQGQATLLIGGDSSEGQSVTQSQSVGAAPPDQNLTPQDILDHVKQFLRVPALAEPQIASASVTTHGETIRGEARDSANVSVVTSEEDRLRNQSQSSQPRGAQKLSLDQTESLSDWYDHHPQSFTEWLISNGDSIS